MINWKAIPGNIANYFKTNYKDWTWWYKLVAILLVTIGLLTDLIVGLVDIHIEMLPGTNTPKWLIPDIGNGTPGWDYDSNLLMFFSYFTNQSNFFVLLWLVWAWLFPKKEGKGKMLGFNWSLLVATYISITCIIWTFMLLPASIAAGTQRNGAQWFTGITLHLIIPVALVLYVVVFMKKYETVATMTWLKRSWMIMIYPVIYGIVMLVRGEARYRAGFNSPSSYPYFFLEVHDPSFGVPGVAWFFIALILIIGIAIGFSTLYVWLINFHRNRMAKKGSSTPTNGSAPVNEPTNNPTSENKPVEPSKVDSSSNSSQNNI